MAYWLIVRDYKFQIPVTLQSLSLVIFSYACICRDCFTIIATKNYSKINVKNFFFQTLNATAIFLLTEVFLFFSNIYSNLDSYK